MERATGRRVRAGWARGRTARLLGVLLAALCGSLLITPRATVQGGSAPMQQVEFNLMEATIPELQAALAAGRVTSRELVQMYLARIAAYDQQGPSLNAISVLSPTALAEAGALDAERRATGPRGPLHGIPIVVKDNYDTANMQTAAGSILLKGFIPPDDATLVKKLKAAGAIVIAKTNMHEWAYGIESLGSLFGQVRNPYAPDRNPGGSSGGTGAAVAANFAAVGMGSDTCGSIRIPSSHNSLVGLRGTQGLTSRTGIVPLSHTQDIGGPLGRSVTDVAIVMDAIAGYDPADPTTADSTGHIPRSYADALRVDGLRGARIGLLTNLFGTDPEDAEVAGVVRAAITEMRGLGAEVVEVTIPDLAAMLAGTFSSVLAMDFKFDIGAYLSSRPGTPVKSLAEIIASGQFHPALETRLATSQATESLDTKDYLERLSHRTTLRLAALTAMADNNLDALAYPTIRRKAALIGEPQVGSNCQLSAQSGLPAILVPGGFTDDGVPVGVELLGRAWGEAGLLRLAYAYEQATHHRRPPASTPALDRR